MTKPEIRTDQLEWIAGRSLINCHCVGLDSVMLVDLPESRIRMFYANKHHELWRNSGFDDMSVALHSHHCDVKLVPITENVYNITQEVAGSHVKLREFIYQSPITKGTGSFKPTGANLETHLVSQQLLWPIDMIARERHTVFVPKEQEAAWFVMEGREDPLYEPLCYSNVDLEKFDFTPLYQPMSLEYLESILRSLKSL